MSVSNREKGCSNQTLLIQHCLLQSDIQISAITKITWGGTEIYFFATIWFLIVIISVT